LARRSILLMTIDGVGSPRAAGGASMPSAAVRRAAGIHAGGSARRAFVVKRLRFPAAYSRFGCASARGGVRRGHAARALDERRRTLAAQPASPPCSAPRTSTRPAASLPHHARLHPPPRSKLHPTQRLPAAGQSGGAWPATCHRTSGPFVEAGGSQRPPALPSR
jgi:hypothetical protein